MEINDRQQNNLNENLINKLNQRESGKLNDLEAQIDLEGTQEQITNMIRIGFIRKVYAILSMQLIVSGLFILFSFNDTIRNIYLSNLFLLISSILTSLIILIILMCYPHLIKKVPNNYFILTLWTFTMSYILGFMSSFYDSISVLMAISLTITVTLSLTIYAFNTKRDFTFLGGLLFVCCSIILFLGILFLISGFNNKYLSLAYTFYCILCVLLYSIFLIYDTQLILGKFGREFDIDDYIIAALMIYIDIIHIFINILKLIGSRRI